MLFMKVDNHSMQTEEQHFMTKLLDIKLSSVSSSRGGKNEREKKANMCEPNSKHIQMNSELQAKILL